MRAAHRDDPDPRIEPIAADPRIVPDLHRVCDGWCEQCPLTERCLAFRCQRELQRTRRTAPGSRPTLAAAALAFHRELSRLDTEPVFDVSHWKHQPCDVDADADHALVAAALDYAMRSPRFVAAARPPATAASPARSAAHSAGPAEVILRHRSSIYFRTTRALVGRTLAAGGMLPWVTEARSSAAQAISCALRSRDALERYDRDDERDALVHLVDAVVQGLAGRFPAAAAWRHHCLQRAFGALKTTADRTVRNLTSDMQKSHVANGPVTPEPAGIGRFLHGHVYCSGERPEGPP